MEFRNFWFFIIIAILSICLYAQSDTRVEIKGKSGNYWILSKGENHGVKVGFTGYFWLSQKSGDKYYPMNIAKFKIIKVDKTQSKAELLELSPGFPDDFQWATFIEKLEPPKPPEKISKKTGPIPPGESIDWYLEKGDNSYKKGNFADAQKYFEKVLSIDPNDPVAKRMLVECQKEIQKEKLRKTRGTRKEKSDSYIDNGNEYVSKGKLNIAIGYYLKAYMIFPEGKNEIVQKLHEFYKGNEAVKNYLLAEKKKEARELLGNIYLTEAECLLNERKFSASSQVVNEAQALLGEAETKELEDKIRDALEKYAPGILEISVFPYAEVFVNGKSIGEVPPVKRMELRPGYYTIVLRKDEKNVFEKKVLIKVNEQTKVHHSFNK